MALVKAQGRVSWQPSLSADTVSYRVYQGTDTNPPTYDSPSVDVGNVTEVALPIAGLPGVEGMVVFGVAAVDGAGNQSDLANAEAVLIDVTAPQPPTEVKYSADF